MAVRCARAVPIALTTALAAAISQTAGAVTLRPETLQAWDQYIQAENAHQEQRRKPGSTAPTTSDRAGCADLTPLATTCTADAERPFRLALIRDPRFATVVNDIVVESGSARYQETIDRFMRRLNAARGCSMLT